MKRRTELVLKEKKRSLFLKNKAQSVTRSPIAMNTKESEREEVVVEARKDLTPY